MIEAVEKCTGCLACYNACPENAVYVKHDEKGFCLPRIDPDRCTLCGRCASVCPKLDKSGALSLPAEIYAAWSRDEKIRAESTSGGVFTGLAKKIVSRGGIVFGAAMDENFDVFHKSADTVEGLSQFRKSKYVQSHVGFTYREAEKELKEGRKVLFSGTPCQIAGLKGYLGNEYDNLLTVDVVCHGVPSSVFFKAYLKYIQKEFEGLQIKDIDFKCKEKSWSRYCMNIGFVSGASYKKNLYKDPYLAYYIGNYCLRESCYDCRYACLDRPGDITLGDFWGYKSESRALRNDDKGISLVLVNTQKGAALMDEISDDYVTVVKTEAEAIAKNSLRKPSEKNEKYDEFWLKFLKNSSFEECLKHFPVKKRAGFKSGVLKLYYDRYYIIPGFIKGFVDPYVSAYLGKRQG